MLRDPVIRPPRKRTHLTGDESTDEERWWWRIDEGDEWWRGEEVDDAERMLQKSRDPDRCLRLTGEAEADE